MLLLLHRHRNNNLKISNKFPQKMSANFNGVKQLKLDIKKKINLKLKMWPVNALRLERCYDTDNDKK